MDKKKLEYFKKRLESRQVDLRRMVTRTEQDGRTVDEDSAQDIADRAASSYTKEFLFHQSNNDRQLLQMVEVALERLRECSELQDVITAERRSELVGERLEVLVDEPGIARSHREAPEIDGVVHVEESLAVGEFHKVVVTGAAGPDLWAET